MFRHVFTRLVISRFSASLLFGKTVGIGLDAKAKAQANWALNTHAYDSILKNLKVVFISSFQLMLKSGHSDVTAVSYTVVFLSLCLIDF